MAHQRKSQQFDPGNRGSAVALSQSGLYGKTPRKESENNVLGLVAHSSWSSLVKGHRTGGTCSRYFVGVRRMGFPLDCGNLHTIGIDGWTVTSIFILDNYDSFVYTLAGYLRELGADIVVVRNDAFDENDIPERLAGFDGILISPGPGTPTDAGLSIPIIRFALANDIPLLGVCLGHQAIAEALGGTVTHADELMHGKTSAVVHTTSAMFDGVPSPFRATRYHSLAIVDGTTPDELRITARTEGGVIMAVEHVSSPMWGVQFHPESVLTEGGYTMIGNWLESTGMVGVSEFARTRSPLMSS